MKKSMSKNIFKSLFASALILGTVAAPVVTFAQDYDTLIENSQVQINQLSASQAALYAQLEEIYTQLEDIHAQANELLGQVATDEKTINELTAQIKELEEKIEKREVLLAEQARSVQKSGGSSQQLNFVASSKSVSDFVGRVDVVKKMVSANKNLLADQRADKEAVEVKRSETEVAKAEKVTKMESLESLKEELIAKNEESEAILNQLTNDLSIAAAQREALVAEKQAFEYAQAVAAVEAARRAEEVMNAQPAVEEQPVVEPVTEESAVQPVAEETVETPVVEEQPVAEPVAEETVETPVVEEQPVAEPVAEETVETPVAEEQPVAEPAVEETVETPVVEEQPVVEEEESVADVSSYGSNYGDVLTTASKYVGTPYVWGGKDPSGFDCSGFVQYVFKEAYGIDVGGWTVPQESAGAHISVSEAQAGDLYFWGAPGGTYHVAIATGGGGFIHASQPGTPLGYGDIQYFTPDFAVRVR